MAQDAYEAAVVSIKEYELANPNLRGTALSLASKASGLGVAPSKPTATERFQQDAKKLALVQAASGSGAGTTATAEEASSSGPPGVGRDMEVAITTDTTRRRPSTKAEQDGGEPTLTEHKV